MADLKEYIDLMGEGCRLMRDKKEESEEGKVLFQKIQIAWNKLTEDEKTYADEQTIRTRLYIGV